MHKISIPRQNLRLINHLIEFNVAFDSERPACETTPNHVDTKLEMATLNQFTMTRN